MKLQVMHYAMWGLLAITGACTGIAGVPQFAPYAPLLLGIAGVAMGIAGTFGTISGSAVKS